MFILRLFLKQDDEASVTRTPKSMMAFSPPPLPPLLSPVVVISVGHVRELWPLFPHCEQLRDMEAARKESNTLIGDRERERERDILE